MTDDSTTAMKMDAAEAVFRASQLICLAAEITISYFHPVFVSYWLLSGFAVSAFYLYTQWAAASGRLGPATQDTYYRNTRGSNWVIAIACCRSCMLAPPVWLAALVARHIRSARRRREQRVSGEPIVVTEPGAWANAIGEE